MSSTVKVSTNEPRVVIDQTVVSVSPGETRASIAVLDGQVAMAEAEKTKVVEVVARGPKGDKGDDGTGTGGSSFTPADLSEFSDGFLYFGFDGDTWSIRRVSTATQTAEWANQAGNGTFLTLIDAWANKASLIYS